MIFRLMAEQKDEDEHKDWCDMETEKSTESKDEKVKKLTAKVAELDSAIKLLVKQITENDAKVAQIAEYSKQETDLRTANHAECEATIKDAQDSQTAITSAIAVLKDFYKEP